LVSFELEPAAGEVPDLHSPPVVPTARGEANMEVDTEIIRASNGLMNAWLVEKDYERALGYLSSDSYRCLENLGEPEEGASGDPRARFIDALKSVSDFLGEVGRDAELSTNCRSRQSTPQAVMNSLRLASKEASSAGTTL